MYFLLKMGIFRCYVSLPEGIINQKKAPPQFNRHLKEPNTHFVKNTFKSEERRFALIVGLQMWR